MLAPWGPLFISAVAELVSLSPTKLILVLILKIGVPRLCKNEKTCSLGLSSQHTTLGAI